VASGEEVLPAIVSENVSDIRFTLYPNPTAGPFTLEQTAGADQASVSVTVYGLHGETVLKTTLNNERKRLLDVTNLPAGMYLVRVTSGAYSDTFKLMKQ
jgi:hypothetical protein